MIKYNRASFTVYSDVRSVASITGLLGIEPTKAADIGEPTPSGRAGRSVAPKYLNYQRTFWSIEGNSEQADPHDESGFSALSALVVVLLPHADSLARLREDSETVMHWSGDSDSSQGGFVLSATLLRRLAVLGCDLLGTAWIDDAGGIA